MMKVRVIFLVTAAAAFAACGSGMSGEYNCDSKGMVPIEKLSFKSDGNVYVTVLGTEKFLQYKVDGDKVSIGSGGDGAVFTKKGENLEVSAMGRKTTCKKL